MNPEWIKRNGGDMAIAADMERLESLPYLTRQHVLSSVGDAVLCDLVDGTTVTPEIIKSHFKRACHFWLERRTA